MFQNCYTPNICVGLTLLLRVITNLNVRYLMSFQVNLFIYPSGDIPKKRDVRLVQFPRKKYSRYVFSILHCQISSFSQWYITKFEGETFLFLGILMRIFFRYTHTDTHSGRFYYLKMALCYGDI